MQKDINELRDLDKQVADALGWKSLGEDHGIDPSGCPAIIPFYSSSSDAYELLRHLVSRWGRGGVWMVEQTPDYEIWHCGADANILLSNLPKSNLATTPEMAICSAAIREYMSEG